MHRKIILIRHIIFFFFSVSSTVPYWASKSNGCMISMTEDMTVTFLPEIPAVQLIKECGPVTYKNVTCQGNMVCINIK